MKNGLDKTLVFVAILDTIFVICMIVIFCIYQSVPDTLIVAVFGATFGECGCCSYIWKIKRTEKKVDNEEVKYEPGNGGADYQIDSNATWNYVHNGYYPMDQDQYR